MIHQYQNNGYHIVLDVNSGSVHVVDKIAYDVIGCLEAMNPAHTPETLKEEKTAEYLLEKLGDIYAEEDLRDLLEAVAELTAAGQLFTQDVYESYIGEVKERKTVVKALCLHIAHDCNLACKYCFAEEGEYHGRRALMSLEVGKKALDFLVANSGKRRAETLRSAVYHPPRTGRGVSVGRGSEAGNSIKRWTMWCSVWMEEKKSTTECVRLGMEKEVMI